MAQPKDPFGNGNSNDYVTICLSEIRKEMQCPICLGIIRKTRTVMECLHRFCRECIDKSMRLGNNECPACRTHCASRRSLRDDPNFDALIAAIYPDLDKYEEEEMMLLEDETRRNKQIQASIAETFKRQSEAVARRRTTAKATAAAIVRKAHGKFRHVQNRSRGPTQQTRGGNNRANNNGPTFYGSPQRQEEEKEEPQINPPSKSLASNTAATDYNKGVREQQEVIKEVSKDRAGWRKRRRPRHVEPENSEEKVMRTTEETPHDEHKLADSSQVAQQQSASPVNNRAGVVTSWARGGARSHTTRQSLNASNSSGRHSNRCVRATALLDFLTSSARKENEDEFDIQLHLSPMNSEYDDEDALPSLERPYLCCPPQMTIQYLCKHLVTRLSLARGGELELLIERISGRVADQVLPGKVSSLRLNSLARGKTWPTRPTGGKIMEVLESKSTLQYVLSTCWDKSGNLDLLYRLKT
ncbi:unnamed protein product [Calypogeia fissa]